MPRRGTGWIVAGILLMTGSLGLSGMNLSESYQGKKRSDAVRQQLMRDVIPESKVDLTDPEVFCVEMPQVKIDDYSYIGTIEIPSLSLQLPVISKWSEDGMWMAPCRYSGSAYTDDMIICAHNSYAHFGFLYRMNTGDTAVLTDIDGNVFTYKLFEQEILQPEDVEQLNSGEWDLTLFTCTFDGIQRRVFRFEKV